MPIPDRMMIVDPTEQRLPLKGLFAIKRFRGGPQRALSVQHQADGVWMVFMDGSIVAPPSVNYHEAFGELCRDGMLIGTPLSDDEYKSLLTARIQDRFSGRDLEAVVDHNTSPVTF